MSSIEDVREISKGVDRLHETIARLESERDGARAEVLRTVRELNDSRAETEQAAASERAKIVALARKHIDGYEFLSSCEASAICEELEDLVAQITRLDHHTDAAAKEVGR